ncbi:ligase-associated DNA damage response endonuclease PdeM [Aquabacter cavernae]|uniref:ligase-associated DNA damage response endonuclease PdeM n=1 Tax=Aquabacter cavernae TaxID=2496029 RepID=UPI000F8F090A|nr:ligase-associated DNA damage response endonuclease PdeM [Aquabacter cavernae]
MLARSDSVPGPLLALNGAEVTLDPFGGLVWPAEHLLVVSDLHLEKGSAYAKRGRMLPPYDTADTLTQLEAMVARWLPRTIIALGDSFHDRDGAGRLSSAALGRLRHLQAGRSFIWIAGNHDPEPSPLLAGEWAVEARIGSLIFRHEPAAHAEPGEVAGHLHPAARIAVRGRTIRRRCFATDGRRIVLPAIGAFAGGLNVRHPALAGLFAGPFDAHMLGRERTYRMAVRTCMAD